MKMVKVITTQVSYLPILILHLNSLRNINIGHNREILVNQLLLLVVDNLMTSIYDTVVDINPDEVIELINEYTSSPSLTLVTSVLAVLTSIKEELTPILLLEALPKVTFESSYILNEYVTFRLYDMYPIERIRRN